MKVLVTGGAGFIGSHIADTLLKSGHEVAVLDDLSSGRKDNIPRAARFFEADIRDAAAVARVFEDFGPEVVSHHAAQASVSVSVKNPALDADVNIMGGLNLLNSSRDRGVRTFIFASTGGAIYGEVVEGKRATVDWTPKPISPYACSKYSFECYLEVYQQEWDLDYRVLRYANIYGPRQDPHGEAGVVAIFCRRLLEGRPIQINARVHTGDEGCIRDYTYVGDVVRANLAVVEGRVTDPVMNVCTSEATSTQQLADGLQEYLGVQGDVSKTPKRPGDLERSVLEKGDFSKIVPDPVPLSEGLRKTADWFRGQYG